MKVKRYPRLLLRKVRPGEAVDHGIPPGSGWLVFLMDAPDVIRLQLGWSLGFDDSVEHVIHLLKPRPPSQYTMELNR